MVFVCAIRRFHRLIGNEIDRASNKLAILLIGRSEMSLSASKATNKELIKIDPGPVQSVTMRPGTFV